MSLRSPDVPAASGERQHVWALTHSLACNSPLLPQQAHRQGHCSVSKHTSERRKSYARPWFNGVCGCVQRRSVRGPPLTAIGSTRDRIWRGHMIIPWIFFRESFSVWQPGEGWVGGWLGGVQGSQKVTCVSMFNPGSRSDIWLARLTVIAGRREDRSHPSSFCWSHRFKQVLASFQTPPMFLLQRLLGAVHHPISRPGTSSCERQAGILSIPAVM